MRDEDVPIVAVGGGLILALAFWKGRLAVQKIADLVGRGKQLTFTTPDTFGVIETAPADLAALASAAAGYDVSSDAYALARMRRSEGTDGAELRMHVALNDLADLQAQSPSLGLRSVTDLITYSEYGSERGFYGTQAGRRYGSSKDPFDADVRLAYKVLGDRQAGIDKAGGAIKFVDKSGFGKQPGTRTYAKVLAEWTADGLVPFTSPDATSNFVLFRRA